jgi:hypothetical protein
MLVVVLVGCSPSTPTAETRGRAAEPAATAGSAEAPTPVSLSLEGANARWRERILSLEADVVVHNRTGAPLNVISTCSSAYDGLTVVLREPSGQEVYRQAFIAHQSPYGEGQVYPLRPGDNSRRLVYPIFELTPPNGPVDVTIEGGFPGTAWPSGLASESVRITISPR